MLQYLIILLDDTSVSFCHYENKKTERRLIPLNDLKEGILFAMKQNLMVQFVYPAYELPESYQTVIESIDNHKIQPASFGNTDADVVVYTCREAISETGFIHKDGAAFVLRVNKEELFAGYTEILLLLKRLNRLTLVVTDIETFRKEDVERYGEIVSTFKKGIMEQFDGESIPQLNLLTDRVRLDKMNNCNAGVGNITLAPNGKFYICPAFYLEDEAEAAGNPVDGLDIPNKQLYKLNYAPLCRNCDAFHCKRCVWLNRKTTLEVNTPSHEQCVTAHLERNMSRMLLKELQAKGLFPGKEIKAIDYTDPFEVKERFQ
ncbi:MAG: CXXX repeat peptide maturase [Tannerellaceae bacterium]|jgi:CXXX repeat peptide maturase|nr:CXXX repeat peptide maturase [Tannerellaceae bacterium]